MSQYADDLKKIVGVDEIKKRLDTLEEAEAIGQTRGVSWNDGASAASKAATGAAGGGASITAPDGAAGTGTASAQNAATTAARDALANAYNSNGSPNAFDPEDGQKDLADLLDNKADRNLQGGGDNYNSFNPSLGAIDGWKDCTTNTDGVVRFNNEAIPPLTWEDSNTPPPSDSEGWQLGYFWVTSLGRGATPGLAIDDYINYLRTVVDPILYANTFYTNLTVILTGGGGEPIQYSYDLNLPTGSGIVARASCTVTEGIDLCPTAAPNDYTWNLEYFQIYKNAQTGRWTWNDYDTNVPDSYKSNPTSTVYMCFEDGARTAVLTAGAGDTTLLYETNPADGTPLSGSQIHIYDGNMQLKGYADVSSLAQYTP